MEPSQPESHLLSTKFYIPHPHPELVDRPSLMNKMVNGLNVKLILVTAPAGYGKSTLLSTFIQQINTEVAWISLDERDNEPNRYWSYFIAALQILESSLGKTAQGMLRSPNPPPIENILVNLLNDLTLIKDDFFIFLDDFHSLTDPEIQRGMTFLIENQPEHMHLVIAGRSEPLFPLPLLRSRRQLLEINASDLRFSNEEATEFLNQLMNLDLSNEQITEIDDITEGWAAGLQLAALSLQGEEDIAKQLSAFTGSHRYIFDYLAQEVLNKQSQEVRGFLLSTSILDQLCGPLCDEILMETSDDKRLLSNDSQMILENLEQANLFIIPLDQERKWYRYHHLFLDFLRVQLKEQIEYSLIEKLHLQASNWFKRNNLVFDAIDHALLAADYSEVISLIYQEVQEIFDRSELSSLTSWIEEIPSDHLYTEPRLNMIAAWAYLATGGLTKVETHLKIIEEIIGSEADGSPESMALTPETRGTLAEISNIRTSLALNRNDLSLALDLSRQTKAYLSDDVEAGLFNNSRDILAVTYFNQAIALEANGEIMEASESFSKAIALNEKNMHLIPMGISHLGHLLELRGLLSKAEETYWSAMRIAEDYPYPLPLSALADVGLGQLFCERNDLEKAKYHLNKGITLGNQWNQWGSLLPGYMGLVRVAMANGTYDQANKYLDWVISTINDFQLPWLMAQFKAYRAAMWARQGELNAASEWSHEIGIELDQPIHFSQEPIAISLISVWIAMQNFDDALQLIKKLIISNESRQAWGQVIQLLIFDALANYSQGDTDTALVSIKRALELAEPENYQRIFLDEGEIMHTILLEVDDSSTGMYKEHIQQYTRQLLAAFQNESTLLMAVRFENSEFIDPLSERELEVFKLLEKGHSNKEIAAKLFISLNTVKAHNKNIFSKLGVNNRVQAITRGQELGII